MTKLDLVTQVDASLRVNLKVGIEIEIAEGARHSSWCRIRAIRSVLIFVTVDVRLVVGQADANRHTPAVVGRADVPGVWRVAQQPGVIGSADESAGARSRIPVVRRESQTAEHAGQKRQMVRCTPLRIQQSRRCRR